MIVTAAHGAWRFSDPHLSRAFAKWQQRESPTSRQVDAFYTWCLSVVESGPTDRDTMPIPDVDESYVAFIHGAEAFVRSWRSVRTSRSSSTSSLGLGRRR